ncbi:hypothetical protein BJP36_36395 [Moorena producens JHB]|uniref:Uncharacterized protein n=1 Tax=Moorena producens (strain JHB) TaxID=1454205 RepID=A0A9Q9UW78_MOOP1|nr:hypothetical protein [Moorena producens]WAN69571.1 hypothetical protein BJP36_36395 [Moorena producens JHB]
MRIPRASAGGDVNAATKSPAITLDLTVINHVDYVLGAIGGQQWCCRSRVAIQLFDCL